MSVYKTNTKKTPVYLVPESTIEIFEDIPKLHVDIEMVLMTWMICQGCRFFKIQLFAQDMGTQKILANRTVDFCQIETYVANIFFHSLIYHLLENLKFVLKCPFKQVLMALKLAVSEVIIWKWYF